MKAKSVFGKSVQEISEKVTSVISAEFNPTLVMKNQCLTNKTN
jgi:hypothetical protein